MQDGVVLGADTRSTAGTVVADKNCEKIHPITDKIFCCGAGTAADCEMVTAMVSSSMKLHSYATGRPARVVTVKTMLSQHLFKYQGHVGAALVLGGVDLNGPHLYSVRRFLVALTTPPATRLRWPRPGHARCSSQAHPNSLQTCTYGADRASKCVRRPVLPHRCRRHAPCPIG